MTKHVDGSSEIILDARLRPLLVATWVGPATLDLIAAFQAWIDAEIARAKPRAARLMLINDGSAAGRPPADVRRAFSEQRVDEQILVRTYAVIDNPLVRGAMTAIGWLIGDRFSVTSCKTMAEALATAATDADALGITLPTTLEREARGSAARSA
ncbi:hypothetical protein [Enhygromyxa salina]|nr:hypothetical protein [Enhygromyxa salina]